MLRKANLEEGTGSCGRQFTLELNGTFPDHGSIVVRRGRVGLHAGIVRFPPKPRKSSPLGTSCKQRRLPAFPGSAWCPDARFLTMTRPPLAEARLYTLTPRGDPMRRLSS